jgi:tRNA(fMet)-specific endonuclease VapC
LLDTNALGHFINNRRGVLDRARVEVANGSLIGTGTPAYGELRYGIEWSRSKDENLRRLKKDIAGIRFWPFDVKAAEEFGRLYAHLRRIGRLMQVIDIQLAAIALTIGDCTVVSSDTDLSAVPGLSVEDWSAS